MGKVKIKKVKPITEDEQTTQPQQQNNQDTKQQQPVAVASPTVQNLQNQVIQLTNKKIELEKQENNVDSQINQIKDQINKERGIVESAVPGVQDLDNSDCIRDDIHPDAKSVVDSRRICYLTHKEDVDFGKPSVGFCYWQQLVAGDGSKPPHQVVSIVFSDGSYKSYKLEANHKWVNACGIINDLTTDRIDIEEERGRIVQYFKQLTDDPTEDEDGDDTYLNPESEEVEEIEHKESTDLKSISTDIINAVFEVADRHEYKPSIIYGNELGSIIVHIPMNDIRITDKGSYERMMGIMKECNDLLRTRNSNCCEKFHMNRIGSSYIPTFEVTTPDKNVLCYITFNTIGARPNINMDIVSGRIFDDDIKTRALKNSVIQTFRRCFGVGSSYLAFLDALAKKKVEWKA